METVGKLIQYYFRDHLKELSKVPIVKNYLGEFLGPKCYKALVQDFNPKDTACLKLALSKALGLLIVVGGGLVKLPQIAKILLAGSAQGLSFSSYLLETVAYCISLAYNHRNMNPFSTYGETAFVTVQNYLIMMLMLSYKRRHMGLVFMAIGMGAMNYALYDHKLVDGVTMKYLQAATIPVSILSKVPQIIGNFMNGSTGQLSSFTVFMYFFGSLARVFTTMQEVNDPIILWGFLLAAGLNGILALQIIYYWSSSPAIGSDEGYEDKKKK